MGVWELIGLVIGCFCGIFAAFALRIWKIDLPGHIPWGLVLKTLLPRKIILLNIILRGACGTIGGIVACHYAPSIFDDLTHKFSLTTAVFCCSAFCAFAPSLFVRLFVFTDKSLEKLSKDILDSGEVPHHKKTFLKTTTIYHLLDSIIAEIERDYTYDVETKTDHRVINLAFEDTRRSFLSAPENEVDEPKEYPHHAIYKEKKPNLSQKVHALIFDYGISKIHLKIDFYRQIVTMFDIYTGWKNRENFEEGRTSVEQPPDNELKRISDPAPSPLVTTSP